MNDRLIVTAAWPRTGVVHLCLTKYRIGRSGSSPVKRGEKLIALIGQEALKNFRTFARPGCTAPDSELLKSFFYALKPRKR